MSAGAQPISIAAQLAAEGSLPDMPQQQVPMRAVVAAAATQNPDEAARALTLSQQSGMGVDLVRHNPEAARQMATNADLDRRELELRNPVLAQQLQDMNFASVAHDDLDSLSGIEQGAGRLREAEKPQGFWSRAWAEANSAGANTNAAAFNTVKPLIDSAGYWAEGIAQTPRALLDATIGGVDPHFDELKQAWNRPDDPWVKRKVTDPAAAWLEQDVVAAPPQYVAGPAGKPVKNPAYHWYGRSLVNAVEGVPGALAGMAGLGEAGGAAAESGTAAELPPAVAGAAAKSVSAAAAERTLVPTLLASQGAQTTYAQARANGVDQHTAVLAAVKTGLSNYLWMGTMPGPVATETRLGAVGQWAGRSVGLGAGMAVTDNAVAQSYDPNRGILDDLPQSIATMAAYEGAGMVGHLADTALGQITDAVRASKLRKRAPEVFQESLEKQFEGDASLRIPAADFVNYYTSQKLDPAEAASRAGVTNLAEAAQAGADLEIPKANFFGKLEPEEQKGLLQDVVNPATNLTARQEESARGELAEWLKNGGMEKLQQELEAEDAATAATPGWQAVKDEMKRQYLAAGEQELPAENQATLQANAMTNLARRAGMTPEELMALHMPRVVAAETPADGTTLYQTKREELRARMAANLEATKAQGELLTPGVQASEIEGKTGAATHLLTPSGKTPATYRAVELESLIPSHDPFTFGDNPAYPQGVQERDYKTQKEAQARVIQQGQNYEPAYTVNNNPDAVNGPPVITPNGVVLGGNSRTMSTARLYREGNPAEYRRAMEQNAEQFGLNAEDLHGMKEPMLVRQVEAPKTQEGMRRLASELNKNMTGALGVEERAVSMGKNMSPDTLRWVSDALSENNLTLRELLEERGAEVMKRLTQDGVVTERERPLLVDAETGGLSEEGRTLVERALLGSVIDDPRLMKATPKDLMNKLARSLGAITSFSARPDEWNLIPALRSAVRELASARQNGVDLRVWMLQRSFDGAERNPLVDALALKMDGKPNAVRDAFATFSRDSDENPPSAVRLFGGGSADEAFNYSFGVNLTEQEYHDGLDAAASKQPYVAPAENAAGDGAVPEISTWDQGAGGEQPAGADADGSEPGDAGERAATSGELEPGEGASASHGQPEGVQGWFRIRGDGTYEIAKTSLGDLSTFVHEPAHAYLEQFRELTQREAASPELKDDFAKIAEWLGTSPEVAYRDGFTVAQHEKWAEANTKYLREGKAPDSYLAQIFRHFSQWLSSVYKRTSRLGVEISPEIRGVMDRLYKSEQATRAAEAELPEPLFKSPEEAGWSEEEYKRYAERQGLNVSDAKARLIKEMHEAWVRERTQQWRQEKAATREAVTTEVDARPEYTAIRSLRRGTLDDGTEMTLNREALVSQFGEERVKALQQLHRGLYRQEGGTDAETAAEVLGFGSGEEMMRALERTPRRQAAIDAAVQARMTAEHGDVRYDGTAEDRARLNMEGDERARQTHSELQALRRQVARERKKAADTREALRAITTQPLEDYQRAARAMVEQKALADLTPMRYLIASRKFSREAFDAVRRGDAVTAAEAKNKELLNHFLYRAAMDAAEYGKKFERWVERVNKMPAQQRLGLAQENSGIDYRDQFNFLMARYGASKWPLTPPERSLRDWADEVYGNGNEVPIDPAVLNEGKAKNYKNVPLSELRNLHDALAVIHHLAGMEFKMFVQGKQVKFAEAKQAMIAAGEKNLRQNPEMTFEENRSFLDRKLDVFRSTDALLVRMERLVEWLDGGKTGPWHDNLWNLAADAQGDEYTMQHEVTRTVTESLENMNPELRRKLATEKVTVEGVGEALTRKRMLAMALNMGNEGNLDRMQKTFIDKGWDPAAIGKIAGLLTREEWQFVQGAWDSLKPLGQRMNEQEQRLSGLPPKMVEVLPLRVTPVDGDSEIELAGGYYPIAYDPKFTDKGRQQNEKEAAQNAMQSGYVRATTARGYTKDRTGYGGPLLFDYERVLTSHVAQVAKDLSHREFMLAAQRLLLDLNVQKMLRERLGPQYEAQMMPWLRTIINDRNGSIGQGLSPVSDGLQKLRGNLVTATIGLKVTTAILQIFHASKMLLYAKPGSIAQALGDMLARPMELTRENQELSPNEMRFRGENLDRDVRAALRDQSHAGTMKKAYVEAARWTLATMDHLMSHTLWRAAYRDGLEKFAELSEREAQRQAVLHADSAVRLGLGTNAPKDLPAIMRNNDFTKLITVLYGFHNGVYNQMRDNAHQFRYGGGVAKLTYSTILTALAPALLGALATGDKPKDGENWGLWAAKKALLFSADTVPLLGSVAHGMVEGRDMQLTPIENVLAKGVKALYHAAKPGDGDRDWLGIGLDAAESAGGILGVPGTGQVVKTARYLRRASAGKVQNPSVWGAVLGR